MELNFRIYDLLARDHRTIQAEELEKLRKDSRYTGKTDKELESKAGRAATRELEERINAAGRRAGLPQHTGFRWLKGFLEAPRTSNLWLDQLTLLHAYLTSRGYPLDTRPIFSRVGLLNNLAPLKRVVFLLGVRAQKDFRNDIIAWDARSMARITKDLNDVDFEGDFEFEEVPFKARPRVDDLRSHEWFNQLGQGETALISIGSPRANLASEYLLAQMFGREPFRAPRFENGRPAGLPFAFAWPPVASEHIESCCAISERELRLLKEPWARAVASEKASALLINAPAPRPAAQPAPASKTSWISVPRVPPKSQAWDMYATIVAQRREKGQIWVVLCGISGPATHAAAIQLKNIEAALPAVERGHGEVMWGVIKVKMTTKPSTSPTGVGDDRILYPGDSGIQSIVDLQPWVPGKI